MRPWPTSSEFRTSVTGPITYVGQQRLRRDLDNYKAGIEGLNFEDVFVPCATPARNDADPEHIYKDEDSYLQALADDAGGVQGDRGRGLHRPAGPRPPGA